VPHGTGKLELWDIATGFCEVLGSVTGSCFPRKPNAEPTRKFIDFVLKMHVTCPFPAWSQQALKGRDIPAQGNALGYGSPHPNKALKGRDIETQGNARTGAGYDERYIRHWTQPCRALTGLEAVGGREPRPQGGAHLWCAYPGLVYHAPLGLVFATKNEVACHGMKTFFQCNSPIW